MTDRERMIDDLFRPLSVKYGLIADACADEGRSREEVAWRWMAKNTPEPSRTPLYGALPSVASSGMSPPGAMITSFGNVIYSGNISFGVSSGTMGVGSLVSSVVDAPYRWHPVPNWRSLGGAAIPDALYITLHRPEKGHASREDAIMALVNAIASGLWTPPEGSY